MSWMATGANSKELLPTKRANLRVAAAAEGILGVAAAAEGVLGVAAAVVAVAVAVPGPRGKAY